MNSLRNIIALSALSGLVSIAGLGAANAQDALTMKPLHGISFDVGSKRAVSYFQNDNGTCRLTLVVAEPFAEDATHLDAVIDAGTSKRLEADTGRPFEFACAEHAQEMSVTPAVLVTSN